ncbi:MAG TPA: nitroreductase [Caulobacteraceae bacterium]
MTHSVPPAPLFGDPLPPKSAPQVLSFLADRRSASAMTLRAPAPSPAELDELLRLAARVPDHGKLGPWRFVVLEGAGKAAYAAKLDQIAAGRPDAVKVAAKLAKLKTPPLGVAVVSHVTQGEIPEWEQILSAAAVCHQLLLAASAMGYGANWITDWYAYDEQARAALGLAPTERIAGFVFIGTPSEAPLERVRPDLTPRVTRYEG